MTALTLLLFGRGQVGTALGVAVPPDKVTVPHQNTSLLASSAGVAVHRTGHGGALGTTFQARLRLLFFTFFTTFANVLTLQVSHNHVQVC